MVSMVRPWKAPVKGITAERPVWARAIFTAFSSASPPVVKKMVLAGPANGARALSFSASST